MNRAVRTLLSVLALATSMGLPSLSQGPAWAAPGTLGGEGPEVAKARQHYKAGEKAFNAGEYAKALAEFEAGYVLVPRPGFLLNMAHTERRLGHAARARELYQRYLEADPGSPQRDEVLGLIADVERTLGAGAVPANGNAGIPAGSDASPPAPSPPPVASAAPSPEVEPDERVTLPPPAPPVSPVGAPAAPPPVEEASPLISAGPPSTAPEPQSASRPVYQRWWFWTALGVVAVGVTAGIIVGTRPGGPAFQSDGTLGRVGQP